MNVEMEKLSKTYKNDIEEMAKTLEAKIKKYEAEGATQTDITNKTRAQEVQQDRLRIQQYEQTAYQELQEKQNQKLNPIIEKAQKAIKDVADAKGLEYVMDATPGKTLLVAKGMDLFSAVKAKLGF
jgi:outer membrane protein